ncbi:LexA/Signal peptidase [Patellaria atrata CBS 101060]|uniref:Mitochondrial inner membrane protease subunit n=1 Tax=Patellaria atrata CBS 101060 TaxID=1346257 RepID=A0A9P4SIV6_9PEZI|nr:LexA/Signal peptidase [Patellaria atrata CBS 101060]
MWSHVSRTPKYIYNIALGVSILLYTNKNIFITSPITGASMAPTLSPHHHTTGSYDLVFFTRLFPGYSARKGEIVSFWTPHEPEKMSVKRIIAKAGDTVIVGRDGKRRGGNGVLGGIEGEGAVNYFKRGDRVSVPAGHVWVEGDNTENSVDSCDYGPISLGLVTGRAKYIVWPTYRIGSIKTGVMSKTKVIPGVSEMPAEYFDERNQFTR